MNPRTSHHAFIPHPLLHVLLLLLQGWWGCCHPQCLDYKPPFEPQQPLAFCKQYSKFGCCDVRKDEEIAARFYTIMDNFDHSGYVTCSKYIRSILCQVGETTHYSDDDLQHQLCVLVLLFVKYGSWQSLFHFDVTLQDGNTHL